MRIETHQYQPAMTVMNSKLLLMTTFVAAVAFSTPSFAMNNIEKAMTVVQGIGDRDPDLATKYINPQKFKYHNPRAYDGVEGVKALIGSLPKEKSPLTVVRAFQDGPYVVIHSQGELSGHKVFFDIFKFEDGRIVEHWDNTADWTPANESGHTATDGPTKAADLEATEKNKKLIRDFYDTIFIKGQSEKMAQYFDGDKFIRHDGRGGDGLSAVKALMQKQAKSGTVMKADQVHMILGEGNFVLVAASGSISDRPVAYYDLFRVENGKIAEHWEIGRAHV